MTPYRWQIITDVLEKLGLSVFSSVQSKNCLGFKDLGYKLLLNAVNYLPTDAASYEGRFLIAFEDS
jgi:hypothetical protein